ncbi:MAG: septum formation inhibitor Maf [Desulfuromonas sp.]|nr:MAG: septum formation inhibitor Maf [Desulfuromonas sp.]
MTPDLILASASPRRRELLERIGLTLEVVPSDVDETVVPDETPAVHVERLSRAKASEVAGRTDLEGRFVLGSDTVVVIDNEILGKPEDDDDAMKMLQRLQGRQHEVWSGFAVIDRQTGRIESGAVVTEVTFRHLTRGEIAGYIATGEPDDKAGSYGIQGIGAALVEKIDGSYTSVVGLPLCAVIKALEDLGVPTPFRPTGP